MEGLDFSNCSLPGGPRWWPDFGQGLRRNREPKSGVVEKSPSWVQEVFKVKVF